MRIGLDEIHVHPPVLGGAKAVSLDDDQVESDELRSTLRPASSTTTNFNSGESPPATRPQRR
jgi:hypothetical protein